MAGVKLDARSVQSVGEARRQEAGTRKQGERLGEKAAERCERFALRFHVTPEDVTLNAQEGVERVEIPVAIGEK